jgi:hypothetical protein
MSDVSSFQVPSYRRHKASGQAVVRLNHRDVYLGKYGSAASREAYKRHVAELLSRRSSSSAPIDITVVEVIAAYLAFAKVYYRKNGRTTCPIQRKAPTMTNA